MAEKIEVQINGESRSFDAAAARAAQQAARLETALHNAARQKAEQKQRRLKLLAPPKIWLQPRKKLPTLPVMLQRKMTEPKHLWTV